MWPFKRHAKQPPAEPPLPAKPAVGSIAKAILADLDGWPPQEWEIRGSGYSFSATHPRVKYVLLMQVIASNDKHLGHRACCLRQVTIDNMHKSPLSDEEQQLIFSKIIEVRDKALEAKQHTQELEDEATLRELFPQCYKKVETTTPPEQHDSIRH